MIERRAVREEVDGLLVRMVGQHVSIEYDDKDKDVDRLVVLQPSSPAGAQVRIFSGRWSLATKGAIQTGRQCTTTELLELLFLLHSLQHTTLMDGSPSAVHQIDFHFYIHQILTRILSLLISNN